MIRIFNVYYSTRTVIRLLGEVSLVAGSFLVAALWLSGPDPSIPLLYENGLLKIAALTVFTLLLTYYFDLYEPQRTSGGWEINFRILLVLSALSFVLAAVLYWDPDFAFGHNLFVAGVAILAHHAVDMEIGLRMGVRSSGFARKGLRAGSRRARGKPDRNAAQSPRRRHGSDSAREPRRFHRARRSQ